MARRYFNHAHIRTGIAMFGKLFNSIYIADFNHDGTKIDRLKRVPLRYMAQSQTRMKDERKNPRGENEFNKFIEYFPRMTYNFDGLAYDSSRKVASPNKFRNRANTNQISNTAAPYTLNFTLNVVALDQTTAIQIIEQIMPYFAPNLNVKVKHPVFDDQEHTYVVTLTNIEADDNYDSLETKRIVRYTLTFEVDTLIYGYTTDADVEFIKFRECGGEVIENVIPGQPPDDGDDDDDEVTGAGIIKKIVVDMMDLCVLENGEFWPLIERDVTSVLPITATKWEEVDEVTVRSYTPDYGDRETERRPPDPKPQEE